MALQRCQVAFLGPKPLTRTRPSAIVVIIKALRMITMVGL